MIYNQWKRIHDLKRALRLKPSLTVEEYIALEEELLEELKQEK